MEETNYLQKFRQGNRARLVVSIATKDSTMTSAELEDVLSGGYADWLALRRAMCHTNAPSALTKKLSKDGAFLCDRCSVYKWEDATPEELVAGAKWLCESDHSSYEASLYAAHPNADAKTLKLLYRNFEDGGYLWEALMLNPNTPEDVRTGIQNRMNAGRLLREIKCKIAELKQNATELKTKKPASAGTEAGG